MDAFIFSIRCSIIYYFLFKKIETEYGETSPYIDVIRGV